MNARLDYSIRQEADRIKKAIAAPGHEERCVTAVAKRILLDGPYIFELERINPVAKSVGAGVWVVKDVGRA